MPRWVIIGIVAGIVLGVLAPSHSVRASDGERFGIFYEQKVNDEYHFSVLHDNVTGQEIACVRTRGNDSSPNCYLTGRKWN